MSLTAETERADAIDEPRGSRLDEWWARVVSTPARRRAWQWGGPIAVTLLAAILRLWNLGQPHSLVFDETYYVKDSWTLMHLGFEGAWPEGADTQFNAGDTNVYTTDPAFVAHPPLGKWIIAGGLAVFGAGDSVGWRIATVLVGVLAVALVTIIAKKLFASTLLATLAGFFMAIDGNAIVMSRVALLDGSVMLFGLLGFGCMLLDRYWFTARLTARVAAAREAGRDPAWGPALWWRPWLLTAGLVFGLCAGVKWSGVYFLAAFGLYAVLSDALVRRRLGLSLWFSGAVLKQAPVTFVLMVPIALVSYFATWTGWLVTSGGYYRQWVEQGGEAWNGALSWVPYWFQNLWHYHSAMYAYHIGLSTPHPYQSNPLTWLAMTRPTSMYFVGTSRGDAGCDFDSCASAITGIANPLMWWAGAAACLYLVYRLVRYRDWRVGLILMGLAAGYLPWLAYLNRTVFQFYTIAFEPYLILALVCVIGIILGTRADARWRRNRGIAVVGVFLFFVTAVSVFFYPIWTGMTVPYSFWQLHMWLPGWV